MYNRKITNVSLVGNNSRQLVDISAVFVLPALRC